MLLKVLICLSLFVFVESMSLPSNTNDQKLSIMLANYRHRFERSINFKKLQWYSNNLQSNELCDACRLLVPEVI